MGGKRGERGQQKTWAVDFQRANHWKGNGRGGRGLFAIWRKLCFFCLWKNGKGKDTTYKNKNENENSNQLERCLFLRQFVKLVKRKYLNKKDQTTLFHVLNQTIEKKKKLKSFQIIRDKSLVVNLTDCLGKKERILLFSILSPQVFSLL